MADQNPFSFVRTRIRRFIEIDNAYGEHFQFRSRAPFKSFDERLQESRFIFSGNVPPIGGYSRRHHSHEATIGVTDNIGWCYTVLHVNPFCPRVAITHLTGGQCSGWTGFNLNALLNPFQVMYRVCERNWLPVKQKNARNMRKAILLSKRSSALSQDLNAEPRSLGFRRTRATKKDKGSTSKHEENPIVACTKRGALMWISESTGTDPRTSEPTFTICCNHGKIKISPIRQPPALLEELLQSKKFRDTIRVYNSVLSFTSIGMKMDYSVVHVPTIELARLYRGRVVSQNISSSRDHYETVGEEFAVKLVTDKGKGKEYDLPGTSEVAGLIVGDMSSTIGERDIVVQFQTDTLQQLRDDHPSYMSLQYPLLFPYGEYGFHPEILLHLETGTSRTRQFLTIREFYAAQIQTRFNQGMSLIKSGRLLHQYIVDIYSAIEEDRLRWARNNQDVLRAELYNNVLMLYPEAIPMPKLLVKGLYFHQVSPVALVGSAAQGFQKRNFLQTIYISSSPDRV
ncbi:unnamed protein product [Brassica oleracea]